MTDQDWFYQDPDRVTKYAHQYVAVWRQTVLGHGFEPGDALAQARKAGCKKPHLFLVNGQREGADG